MLHIVVASLLLHDIWHPLSGNGYQFWSGIGSDFGELAIIGGLLTIIRSINCHKHRCWRIGKHPIPNTPFKVCKKHHPGITGHVTQSDLDDAHRNVNGSI